MSFAARSPARSLQRNSGSEQQAGQSPVLKSSRDGDTAYIEDSRAIGEAVKKIQQHTADIRRETGALGTAHSLAAGRKARDAARAAQAAVQEAKRLLAQFPTRTHSSVSEQTHRRLTQQKLTESLVGASKALDEAYRAYESAEANQERKTVASTATPALTTPMSPRSCSSSLDMDSMEGGAAEAPQRLSKQRLQELEVSQAEVDMHSFMVDEYVQEISSISSNINSLQRAMVDLAEHAQSQGVTLDVIEANMSSASTATDGAQEQLVYASRHQRMGSKLTFVLVVVVVLVVVALVLVVARKSS